MHVAAHDPYTSDVAAASLGVNLMPLEALCKEVDFITLHLPLTDGTRDLIDSEMIAHMKPSVRIINAARGGVVNEEALLEVSVTVQRGESAFIARSSFRYMYIF